MASASSRRLVSQRPVGSRQGNRADDPWCLICGVNLALDGRTFSTISRTQNGELGDVFARVLGVKLSPTYGSVHLCNKCERQLKRISRHSSVALARQEGKTLREQLEKNLVKHGQNVAELEDVNASLKSAPPTATQIARDDQSSSVASFNSSTAREHSSRSTSVHFADERETGGRGTLNRTHSVPDRNTKKPALSSASDANKGRDVRYGNRSSVSYASDDRAPSFRTSSADRKSSVPGKGLIQRSSSIRSSQKANTSDLQKKTIKSPTKDNASIANKTEPRADNKGNSNVANSPVSLDKYDRNGVKDDEILSDKSSPFETTSQAENAGECFEPAKAFDNNVLNNREDEFAQPENGRSVEEIFIKQERVRFKDSSPAIESSNNNVTGSTGHTNEALENVSSTDENLHASEGKEDTEPPDENLQESAYSEVEESKNQPEQEIVGTCQTLDESYTTTANTPTETPAQGTTQRNKGDKQQESAPLITDTEETKDDNKDNEEDYDKTSGFDEISNAERVENKATEDSQNLSDHGHDDEDINIQTQPNDSQEHEIVNEEIISEDAHATHLEPSVNIKSDDDDHRHRVQFAKETREVDESQPSLMQSQGEEAPATKTEDSPLIEKDKETSDSKGKKGKDSKFKDQQPGVLCCTIL